MRVLRASALGMCFGVRDALTAMESIDQPALVSVAGELVHNPAVLDHLARRGFQQQAESDRQTLPTTPIVLITAHGTSNRRLALLQAAGKQVVDTTCPLVRRVHEGAQQLAAEGRLVLLIGRQGHVEVAGVVEDLAHYEVVGSVEQVREYASRRLGIVCQTTMPPELVRRLTTEIALHNPLADIRLIDTVCRPTRERQQAVLELLPKVDAMVVVGGRNSHNTRQLAALCQAQGVPALQVEHAGELAEDWFADCGVVGLTAGTSTLDSTIDQVQAVLVNMQPNAGASPCSPDASPARCALPHPLPIADSTSPSAAGTRC